MSDLVPNDTPNPSALWNDPMWAPYAGPHGVMPLDMSMVPEDAAIVAPDGSTMFTPQGPVTDLMAIRQRFPYLPILPFPNVVRSLFLTAGVAQDLIIPDGMVLMSMRGNLDYYLSRAGRAAIPTAANTAIGLGVEANQSFYAPQGYVWYIGGMKQFSVVTPADAIVSCFFYAPPEMPR